MKIARNGWAGHVAPRTVGRLPHHQNGSGTTRTDRSGLSQHWMMNSSNQGQRNRLEGTTYRELRLLEEVEGTPELSQRNMANRLGVALGVANLLVRNLAKKGYIRANRVGWKRWVYVVTPAGIARKAHLTFAYVERFRDHYRRVRTLVREDIGSLAMRPGSRIAIYGATELAELMYLALRDMGLTSVDVYVQDNSHGTFLGMPVRGLDRIAPAEYARVMVAFSTDIRERYQELVARGIAPEQIVAPLQNSIHGPGIADKGDELTAQAEDGTIS